VAEEREMTGKNTIMIFGPKDVEFRTADGDVLSIAIPRNETAVVRHFQKRIPHGSVRAGRGRRRRALAVPSPSTTMTQKPKPPRPPKPPAPPPTKPLPPAA
jgi:hypothetical protein